MEITEVRTPEHWTSQERNRFYSKIEIKGIFRCIVWTGARSKDGNGYALFDIDGKTRVLHRYLWRELNSDLRDDELLDHFICQNKACINLVHLQPVTARENVVVRGSGITAQNALKTKCPKGHEYSGVNNRGRRICAICQKDAVRRQAAKRKALGISRYKRYE